jgi:hypothetical protein
MFFVASGGAAVVVAVCVPQAATESETRAAPRNRRFMDGLQF